MTAKVQPSLPDLKHRMHIEMSDAKLKLSNFPKQATCVAIMTKLLKRFVSYPM